MKKMSYILFLFVFCSSFLTLNAQQHNVSVNVGVNCSSGNTTGIVFPNTPTNITEGSTYTVPPGTLPSGYDYVTTIWNALRGSTFEIESGALTEDIQVEWVLWNIDCNSGHYNPNGSLLETAFNAQFTVYHKVGSLWIPVEPYPFVSGKYAVLSLKNTLAFQALVNASITGGASALQFAFCDGTQFSPLGLTTTPPTSTTDTNQYWVIKAAHFSNIVGGNKNQILGVSDNNNQLPTSYSLKQNYPNPFNPSTVIEYSLPEKSNVELNIYNILGVKVATLVKSSKEAGIYKVEFNGSAFSSGLYIYELKTNKSTISRKMLLLK